VKRFTVLVILMVSLLCIAGCFSDDNLPATTITPDSITIDPKATPYSTDTLASGTPTVNTPVATPENTPTNTPRPTTPPETNIDDSVLVRVTDYIPGISQKMMYATTENFTGIRVYDFTDAYLRYGTVKKLAFVVEELEAQGLGLLIWDAFRPLEAQQLLWDICPDPTYVSNPKTGNRTHCRGSAVDVTLIDLSTGRALAMPSGFDDFTEKANREYSDVSAEAAANAILLENVMVKHGFKPYANEWWHYADSVEYSVEETYNPAMPIVWEANCQDYINLRRNALVDSKSIAKIYKGSTFTLLGWTGKFAKVEYNGKIGYVMGSYIKPSLKTTNGYKGISEYSLLDSLAEVEITDSYSYSEMLSDIATLAGKYPDLITVESIGSSEQGRDLPVVILGNKNAEYHVFIQGAIHAREHMTSWLLMAMIEYWSENNIQQYGDVCFHIVPMSNPDGVVISQTKTLNEQQKAIYQNDKKAGYTNATQSNYASSWKANAMGVDINRNFSSGWDKITERNAPSAELYRGAAPFSTAEARALRDYTLKYDFDVTISYHATGSILYYQYGKKEPVNSLSKSLAQTVKNVSGYTLTTSNGVDGAGYKDWAMEELGIPSITIEIGCEVAVLEEREVHSIFSRNYRVLPAVIRWLMTK